MRLGPIADLASRPETFLPEARIMVRHDARGFSAMSTECTYDLAPLAPTRRDGKVVWVSAFSTSSYDEFGHVLQGPARKNLPYFKLRIDAGSLAQGGGAQADTLFVDVGEDEPESWRLPG
jgi:Rieske Fe-S protein